MIFPRIDVKKEMKELEKEAGSSKKEGDTEARAEITIEDFSRIDLRVARIVEAERIKGTDKLLRLKLELGDSTRQVVSGIAKNYSPENLPGKSVILVANLRPVKLKGVESQGMILAACEGGNLVLATLDGDIKTDTRIT